MKRPGGKAPSKKIPAYACSTCGQTWNAKMPIGKALADQCCTCTEEGCTRMPGYMGSRTKCKYHLVKETVERAEESLKAAQEYYERAKAEWLRLAKDEP